MGSFTVQLEHLFAQAIEQEGVSKSLAFNSLKVHTSKMGMETWSVGGMHNSSMHSKMHFFDYAQSQNGRTFFVKFTIYSHEPSLFTIRWYRRASWSVIAFPFDFNYFVWGHKKRSRLWQMRPVNPPLKHINKTLMMHDDLSVWSVFCAKKSGRYSNTSTDKRRSMDQIR